MTDDVKDTNIEGVSTPDKVEEGMANLGEDESDPSSKKFYLKVDPDQDNKATELKVCSFKRPHMRAFHYSWWSFFIAFFIWFSIAPLLPEVRKTLELSKEDIWTTNIVAVTGDIFMRFIFGAVCDKFGARLPMGLVLMAASIPTAMTGLVNNLTGLIFLRLFIGIAGSSFVMCQCWSTRMFSKDIVGIANGLVGGWGNVGGGVTQIVMGTLLFPLFRDVVYDGDSEKAWRTVCVVPAVVAFITAIVVVKTSEDCPDGNYSDLKKQGRMPEISAAKSFRAGAIDLNTWLLFVQYACCFGVELTMNNFSATYFVDEFGLTTETASAIASIFGFMNIFARGLGGFTSDKFMIKFGMRGRIFWQGLTLIIEGVLIFLFASVTSLWAAILLLTLFSIFVQAAEGSTYGIVPYINPSAPGAVAGIVGAGGPTGAVAFGLGFRQLAKVKDAYFLMASLVLFSGCISLLFNIKGHKCVLFGQDDETKTGALRIPDGDDDIEGEDDAEKDVIEVAS
mmetsp:Transcript_22596/g.37374  ORF Transcript_22596/g.37374 Transcript_22596/m.37374 type:complete len:507 (-) Transcript_22596:1327-2847(-)